MLKYTDYDIVFSEIPDEICLAVNISGCPNNCIGCHSPQLKEDVGEELNTAVLEAWLERYESGITCFCFMGGDSDPETLAILACHLRKHHPHLKLAWYSGRSSLPEHFPVSNFHYIKLGPYIEALGGFDSPTTNQRLYKIEARGRMSDISMRFRA